MTIRITMREFVRHTLFKTGLLGHVRRLRNNKIGKGEGETAEERFSHIYREALWQSTPSDPLSGRGSSSDIAQKFATHLPDFIEMVGASSIVDVGCGDFNWMRNVPISIDYIGIDVVPDVISRNQTLYGCENRKFLHLDAIKDDIPTADIALCREILFHLSLSDARSVIRNIARSGVKWFMATTDSVTSFNSDIDTGDFRILNLQRRPFSLPAPDYILPDDGLMPKRVVGVWATKSLPNWVGS